MRRGRPPHPELLTPREQQVHELLRRGLTNQEIAETLGITTSGAAYHVSEILSKLGVSSRYEAAELEPEVARRRYSLPVAFGGLLNRMPTASLRRATGVTVLVGSVAALLLLALGVWLMSMRTIGAENSLDCVSGEAARNPVSDSGAPIQVGKLFETIAEAEAFICKDVPQIQQPGDWVFIYALAERTHSLQDYRDTDPLPDASRHLSVTYSKPRGSALYATLTFTTTDIADPAYANCMMGEGTLSDLIIQGTNATLWERTNAGYKGAILCWEEDGIRYRADLVVHDETADMKRNVLPDVLILLETIE